MTSIHSCIILFHQCDNSIFQLAFRMILSSILKRPLNLDAQLLSNWAVGGKRAFFFSVQSWALIEIHGLNLHVSRFIHCPLFASFQIELCSSVNSILCRIVHGTHTTHMTLSWQRTPVFKHPFPDLIQYSKLWHSIPTLFHFFSAFYQSEEPN